MSDRVRDFLDRVVGIHEKLAKDAGLPSVVHCRACGSSLEVDPAECLAKGWPKCCGSTMTIDSPPPRCPCGDMEVHDCAGECGRPAS